MATATKVDELVERARELMRRFDTDGYEEAVPLLRQAIEIEPAHAPAYVLLAQIYAYWGFRREISGQEAQGMYDMSYDFAEIALNLGPDRADSHRAMAIALRRGAKADPERRKQEVTTALDLDPDDAETWCESWRVNGYDPEDPAVKRAVELDPELCETHIDLGAVYCELERYDDAVAELSRALKINPRNALAYYDLAMVFDRKGDRAKAIEILRKAAQLRPGDPLLDSGLEVLER